MFIIRDKDGFVTDEQMQEMYESLPIVVGVYGREDDWELITKNNWLDWGSDLQKPDEYQCWKKVRFID